MSRLARARPVHHFKGAAIESGRGAAGPALCQSIMWRQPYRKGPAQWKCQREPEISLSDWWAFYSGLLKRYLSHLEEAMQKEAMLYIDFKAKQRTTTCFIFIATVSASIGRDKIDSQMRSGSPETLVKRSQTRQEIGVNKTSLAKHWKRNVDSKIINPKK